MRLILITGVSMLALSAMPAAAQTAQLDQGAPTQATNEWHLPTEPWTYLINSEGVIEDRLSGAYGVDELEEAMATILPR